MTTKTFTIELSPAQLKLIVHALGNMPFVDIRAFANEQNQTIADTCDELASMVCMGDAVLEGQEADGIHSFVL